MSEQENYIVEILEYPQSEYEDIVDKLSAQFNKSLEEIEALMQRFPGVATKPMSRDNAYLVSQRFESAGLSTVVRPVSSSTAQSADVQLSTSTEVLQQTTSQSLPKVSATSVSPTVPQSNQDAVGLNNKQGKRFNLNFLRRRNSSEPSDENERDVSKTYAGIKAEQKSQDNGEVEQRRVSLRTKFLLAVLFPVLLTLLGALAVISLNVAPTLRSQLLTTAKAPALTTVDRIESLLPSTELANERLGSAESLPVLQETIEGTRRAFSQQNIAFIAIADRNGHYQSGWFSSDHIVDLEAVQQDLNSVIFEQTEQAVRLGQQYEEIPENENKSTNLQVPGLGHLEVISQPIRRSGQTLGAVTVGVNTSLVTQRVRSILRTTIGVTLIPIVLAILIAFLIGRALTSNVVALTEAADRLSRGDLDTAIEVKSNDELGDLSDAFERLRVSLRLAMNRLRRKSRQSN